MRELDSNIRGAPAVPRLLAIVGAGRLGSALADALRASGLPVDGPLRRGETPAADADAVLLCVGDHAIADAAAGLQPGPLVGHCSGATRLDVLAGHEAFSLHPLLAVTRSGGAAFAGAGCAVSGSTPRALAVARGLADRLRMRAVTIADEDRVAYHAAASIASNFLVTLEAAAERLAATAGVDRTLLGPLVRAAVENWLTLGAREALTGPISRGDERVLAAQRTAVAERAPDLLDLFDALTRATRTLAATPRGDGR
jgi:predicted short-subunit dehydrogenase-like oxidoreductase (DUF2520 family)